MKNADEPAFPIQDNILEKGLTKREYFAAMAMQGILANPNWAMNEAYAAEAAIAEADKLLKHLES